MLSGNSQDYIVSTFVSKPWPFGFEGLVGLLEVVVLAKYWALAVKSFKGVVSPDNAATNVATKDDLGGEVSGLWGWGSSPVTYCQR